MTKYKRIPVDHIVSISGGKDSTATALMAVERGIPFRGVFADTGNENPITINHVAYLADALGIEIQTIKQDFTNWFARRRIYIRDEWPKKGVSSDVVERALSVMNPTGIPFLDLVLLKGRFPSRRAQFCTEWLKTTPIMEQVMLPSVKTHRIVSWTGERRSESLARVNLPKFIKYHIDEYERPVLRYRPILDLSIEDVFDLHKRHGIEPNPLYRQGMGRVGCFPCINVNKAELRSIVERYPEFIDMIEEWEQIAGLAAKRGASTFFSPGKTPRSRKEKRGVPIREAAQWSMTERGGRQYPLLGRDEDVTLCSSMYGLCE